jgi:dihydrofolate reductase
MYGRRMYETMVAWETMDDEHPVMRDFAELWRAAEKVVYSRSLEAVSSARTRLERDFDPDAVRRLKESSQVSIGGPGLAAEAIRAGLVDEYHLFLVPMVVGGGKRALPEGVRLELALQDERRFGGGAVSPLPAAMSSAGPGGLITDATERSTSCSRRQPTSPSSAG